MLVSSFIYLLYVRFDFPFFVSLMVSLDSRAVSLSRPLSPSAPALKTQGGRE